MVYHTHEVILPEVAVNLVYGSLHLTLVRHELTNAVADGTQDAGILLADPLAVGLDFIVADELI